MAKGLFIADRDEKGELIPTKFTILGTEFGLIPLTRSQILKLNILNKENPENPIVAMNKAISWALKSPVYTENDIEYLNTESAGQLFTKIMEISGIEMSSSDVKSPIP